MNEWKQITETEEYKNQLEIDALSDSSQTYYQEKRFFEGKGYGYLMGLTKEKGKIYEFNTSKVRDNKIKGDICLQYKLYAVSTTTSLKA